jgi:uncharacterized protein YcaQ
VRRIALAAQGFGARRAGGAADWRRIGRAIGRMGLLQLDSVNVLVRTHYLPAFSRLGPYDRTCLDRKAFGPGRRALFEYWAHEASLLPLALHPLLRWRMARAERGQGVWDGFWRFARERPAFVKDVLAEVRDRGELSARDLSNGGRRSGPWWGRSDGKIALEYLFWTGRVTAATRRGFERVYDLPERALPADILALPTPPEADAQRDLVRLAARALGVATEADLRDYFRLSVAAAKRCVAELAEAGALLPVRVEGWRSRPISTPPRAPRRVGARPAVALRPADLGAGADRTPVWLPLPDRDLHAGAPREYGYYVLPSCSTNTWSRASI